MLLPPPHPKKMSTGKHISKEKENVQVLGLFLALSLYTSEQSNPLGSPVKSWRNQLRALLRGASKIKTFQAAISKTGNAFSAMMETDISCESDTRPFLLSMEVGIQAEIKPWPSVFKDSAEHLANALPLSYK